MAPQEISLAARIAFLEQKNDELTRQLAVVDQSAKTWRTILLAVALTALLVPFAARLTMLNTENFDLVAKSFKIRDANGVVRASLYLDKQQFPILAFYDYQGTRMMNVAAGNDGGAGLFIFDENKKERLSLCRYHDGRVGLEVYNPIDQKKKCALTDDARGNFGLMIADDDGTRRATVGVWTSGVSGVETWDDRGKKTFQSPQ